jgi:membrane fusion protein (multidrug efflux system)
MVLDRTQTALFIPAPAVLHAPFGDSVFIIEEAEPDEDGNRHLQVRQQFIRTGTHRGDFIEVVEGLELGQKVVSTGVFKLRSQTHVVIDNSLAPEFKFDPRPDNS